MCPRDKGRLGFKYRGILMRTLTHLVVIEDQEERRKDEKDVARK
jgi:hypothetical protein